ncbi:MAG: hypothetical protein V2J12_03740 [Gammaproteobacteria bacterium]|jgi:hypothetical protein|nr:hypothetical protein [Gammaproteobacteria bacterium]
MLNIAPGRFIWTFAIGFLVASMLNWGIAEFVLNDWAMPEFNGFMRTVETGGADPLNIVRMTLGLMLPLLVMAWLQASLPRPAGWVARAVVVALLMSLGAFYGTYTFISGWGNVNWWPLMVTATCDSVTLVVGALLIGFLQEGGLRPPVAAMP